MTKRQIEEYNPPPNPAKITDPRADWYIEKFGDTCWEIDALAPQTLHQLVQNSIESLMDMDLFAEMLEREENDKERLKDIIGEI